MTRAEAWFVESVLQLPDRDALPPLATTFHGDIVKVRGRYFVQERAQWTDVEDAVQRVACVRKGEG